MSLDPNTSTAQALTSREPNPITMLDSFKFVGKALAKKTIPYFVSLVSQGGIDKNDNYRYAGYEMARLAPRVLRSRYLENEYRDFRILALRRIDDIIRWFKHYYPSIMQMVPTENEKDFIAGVWDYHRYHTRSIDWALIRQRDRLESSI